MRVLRLSPYILLFSTLVTAATDSQSILPGCCLLTTPLIALLVVFVLLLVGVYLVSRQRSSSAYKLESARKELVQINSKDPVFKQGGIVFPKTRFIEERAIREWTSSGSRFRVSKNSSFSLGRGHSESHGELRTIDEGTFTITNDSMSFSGSLKNIVLQIKKMNHFEITDADTISIGVENRQKLAFFSLGSTNRFRLSVHKLGIVPEINKDEIITEEITRLVNLPVVFKETDLLDKNVLDLYLVCANLVLASLQNLATLISDIRLDQYILTYQKYLIDLKQDQGRLIGGDKIKSLDLRPPIYNKL